MFSVYFLYVWSILLYDSLLMIIFFLTFSLGSFFPCFYALFCIGIYTMFLIPSEDIYKLLKKKILLGPVIIQIINAVNESIY